MFINFWYPMASSEELTDKPMKVRGLGQDFVLFRGEDGKAKCLSNTCTHRGGSLSGAWCHWLCLWRDHRGLPGCCGRPVWHARRSACLWAGFHGVGVRGACRAVRCRMAFRHDRWLFICALGCCRVGRIGVIIVQHRKPRERRSLTSRFKGHFEKSVII